MRRDKNKVESSHGKLISGTKVAREETINQSKKKEIVAIHNNTGFNKCVLGPSHRRNQDVDQSVLLLLPINHIIMWLYFVIMII